MLYGLAHRQRMDHEDYLRDRKLLLRQQQEADDQLCSEKAQKEALKLCVGALVDELAKVAAGTPVTCRHSNPAAQVERCEDYLDTVVDVLKRDTKGRLEFVPDDLRRVRKGAQSLKDIATKAHYALGVVRAQ